MGGRNLSTYREKGEDLLVAALMSDSDDDVNEDGQTVGRKLLRPHWRSDAVSILCSSEIIVLYIPIARQFRPTHFWMTSPR